MIHEIIEKNNIQEMQDGLAHLANISVYCVDGDGEKITHVSGDHIESERLLALVGQQRLHEMYTRVCRSPMEDQLVEDTEYENIKIAAVAVKQKGKPILCWLACCVLQEDDVPVGESAAGFYRKTTEEKLYLVLDLLRMWMMQLCNLEYCRLEVEAENHRNREAVRDSYKVITEILNVVGNCVCVRDAETKRLLFANQLFKHNFGQEMEHGTLDRILDKSKPVAGKTNFYELYHLRGKRWYDMHYTYINWVDGRKAVLFALYDITDKKLYQENIEEQVQTDFLTGLRNRLSCERDLAVQIARAEEVGQAGTLLYLDLDDFKHINDGLGHQYGDVLLKAVSRSLQCVEGIQDSCYRVGGDEFVIIIPPEKHGRIKAIINKIKDVFSKPWFLKDGDYYCTMSMGVCSFPENGNDVQELIRKADIVMYEAKRSGKNRVVEYTENIHSTSGRRLDMEKEMRNAASGEYREFEVYFQPIMNVQAKGAPCAGAEALVRWNSPALGFVSPGEFIPLAEYLGLIIPIGNHVMKRACRACKYWNEHGHPEFKINVNLSVVQLVQTDVVDVVRETLEETRINPKNLTLEVTEGLAINDMKRMKEILHGIREMGVSIALDDFGTGYSSLNHIREIPLDVIKVDQSFVTGLAEDSYTQAFIKMVAELADAIGVKVCVEGIENWEQYKVLENMHVSYVQGYYFDKPLSQTAFEKKYLLEKEM